MADETLQQTAAIPTPAPEESVPTTNVVDPEGNMGSLPTHQLTAAMKHGYTVATPEQVDAHKNTEKYGSAGQQAIAGLEAAGETATFGLSTAAETALGVKPEDISGRREEHPGTRMLGSAAGLVGSAFVPGVGAANILEHAGAGVAKTLGVGAVEGAGLAHRIGSIAVKSAVETALVQSGDEVSKMIISPHLTGKSVETAIADIGFAGLIGGLGTGALYGAVNPLWRATMGSKTGQALKAMADKTGGIDNVVSDAMHNTIQTSGLDVPAPVRAALSDDPHLVNMFKTLEQSDTTKSGQELQKVATDFRKDVGDHVARTLGKDPAQAGAELSHYESGKKIGNILADEYSAQLDPVAKEFETIKGRYANTPLLQDEIRHEVKYVEGKAQKAFIPGEYEAVEVPTSEVRQGKAYVAAKGTATKIADEIGELAAQQGWTQSPTSDIMKEVNRVIKEVKAVKDLKGLTNYVSRIGENTASTLPFGQQTPVSRAGSMMKAILKDHEAETAIQRLGRDAPELVERFQGARDAYKAQAALKEALDDRLGVRGSVSGFAKGLRNMAQTDGEGLLRKLSGTKDADLLSFLQKSYPKTAEALREYHLTNVLKSAADKAKPGENINVGALRKAVDGMSPEMREFAIPKAAQAKIDAVGHIIDQLNKAPHNFSNTARTADKLFSYLPGSAMGLATGLIGHSPAAGIAVGVLSKALGRDAPDAIRLAMLKFLGSDKPIEAGAFKSMVDFIHSNIKGEHLVSRAVKNVFKAGTEVAPRALMPSEKERNKLDKTLHALQADPSPLLNIGGETSHYLPDHAAAMGTMAANTVNFLNNARPATTQPNPMDRPIPPTATQKAQYNRLLNIAQQPLVIVDHIRNGTVNPQDVVAMKTMYPSLYASLNEKFTAEMVEANRKGTPIPYRTRLGLSQFMGQPLDSTMTAASIQAAQPTPEQQAQRQQQSEHKPPSETSMRGLSKLPSDYKTQGQRREQMRGSKP